MYETRYVVLTTVGISLVLALIYLIFLDWCAIPLAYLTIVIIEVALVLMGYFAYD